MFLTLAKAYAKIGVAFREDLGTNLIHIDPNLSSLLPQLISTPIPYT
jgi:hypothetical protein